MKVTRTSQITGITRTINLPITIEQYEKWVNGTFVQNAFPHLSPLEREFIITGVTEEEWEKFIVGEDDQGCEE